MTTTMLVLLVLFVLWGLFGLITNHVTGGMLWGRMPKAKAPDIAPPHEPNGAWLREVQRYRANEAKAKQHRKRAS